MPCGCKHSHNSEKTIVTADCFPHRGYMENLSAMGNWCALVKPDSQKKQKRACERQETSGDDSGEAGNDKGDAESGAARNIRSWDRSVLKTITISRTNAFLHLAWRHHKGGDESGESGSEMSGHTSGAAQHNKRKIVTCHKLSSYIHFRTFRFNHVSLDCIQYPRWSPNQSQRIEIETEPPYRRERSSKRHHACICPLWKGHTSSCHRDLCGCHCHGHRHHAHIRPHHAHIRRQHAHVRRHRAKRLSPFVAMAVAMAVVMAHLCE